MQTKTELYLKRLLIVFFLSSSIIILLRNYNISKSSFSFNLFSLIAGSLMSFIIFIPIYFLTKRTGVDFIAFAQRRTPAGIVFISMFYAVCFVYTAEYFLIKYSDMFVKKLNQEANIYVVAFITILLCAYTAHKGVNAITRSAVFLFAFSLVAYIVIFAGCIPSLDFTNNDFGINGTASDFLQNTLFFATPSFTAVIFTCISGYTPKLKLRQIGITIISTAILFSIILFFTYFALGNYGYNQEYHTFVLSKISHIGTMNGLESLYLSICTISVFLTISILLCSVRKNMCECGSLKIISIFALIIFALFICAENYNSIKEILINPICLLTLTIIGAIVIPTAYYLIFGRKTYA